MTQDIDITTAPIDFLQREIHVGDTIVYPTGGTSCRMVLAKVVRIDDLSTKEDRYYNQPYDGLRGKARWRLVVNRLQEGVRTPDSRWKVDSEREVRIDQLHRVVVVLKGASS